VHGVEYADRVEIVTPEGVDLSLELAGLGSRFIGEIIDTLLKGVLIALLAIALYGIAGGVGAALFAIAAFLVWFFYDVLFEVLAGGRTPGKRAAGIRVVRTGGEPVGFTASAIRNLVRIVDGPVTSYIVGVVAIVASKRNQRLGDMAAGTLVTREAPRAAAWPAPRAAALAASPDSWDVSAVTGEEIATVRHYLDRRWTLDDAARHQLAYQLAEGLRAKVAGVPDDVRGESFLERLAAAKAARG
jgi:uncharacterized RDD family membrane protein YckC